MHDLINGLREQGVTVFLTTHRLDEAERLCDRVAILNTRLRTIGRPDDLRQTLFTSRWWSRPPRRCPTRRGLRRAAGGPRTGSAARREAGGPAVRADGDGSGAAAPR